MNGVAERRVAILSELLELKGTRARTMKVFRITCDTLSGHEIRDYNNKLRALSARIAGLEGERQLFQRRA